MNINEALVTGFTLGVFSSIVYAVLIFLPEVRRKSEKISKLNAEVAKLNLLLRIK